MDISTMIAHYKRMGFDKQGIFDMIEHDFKHMGLSFNEYDRHIVELKKQLKLE